MEEAKGLEMELEITVCSLTAVISPYFVTNADKMLVNLEDVDFNLRKENQRHERPASILNNAKMGALLIIAWKTWKAKRWPPWWSTKSAAWPRLRLWLWRLPPCWKTSPSSPAAKMISEDSGAGNWKTSNWKTGRQNNHR